MIQAKARIFLGDERGLSETAWFRSRQTFRFGPSRERQQSSFGNIYVMNDDVLEAGHSLDMQTTEDSYVVLLPVIGAIAFEVPGKESGLLAAGQAQFLPLRSGESLTIRNPFQEELVNFLQVWIRTATSDTSAAPALTHFDVNQFMNCLVQISPQRLGEERLPFILSVGKFSGRGETTHYPRVPDAGLFVFVLEGAFEVEGRLLHPRDGLALCETEAVEVEALSNDALLLVIEQPLPASVL